MPERQVKIIFNSTVVGGAFAPSTLSGYGTGLGRFLDWCDEAGVSEEDRCPAPEVVLVRFVLAMAGSLSGEYIGKILSAIGAWHKIYGMPWCFAPGSSLSLVLRGAVALTPASSKRSLRDPYTTTYLRALRPHLDTADPLDAAVWACALCAFWGLARVGELTVPTQRSFDPGRHASRAAWTGGRGDPGRPAAGTVRLPWTKTTRHEGGLLVLVEQEADLCPVRAVLAHLALSPLPSTAALFAYRRERAVPLSRFVFLGRLRRAAASAGLPRLHGHSFRIGGCTQLLLGGASVADVKAAGRWRSDAWTVYVREHAAIFASRLASRPDQHAALLSRT